MVACGQRRQAAQGRVMFLSVLLFCPISSAASLPHCQFRRSRECGKGGLAEAGNIRVVFGEFLVLHVSFLR